MTGPASCGAFSSSGHRLDLLAHGLTAVARSSRSRSTNNIWKKTSLSASFAYPPTSGQSQERVPTRPDFRVLLKLCRGRRLRLQIERFVPLQTERSTRKGCAVSLSC